VGLGHTHQRDRAGEAATGRSAPCAIPLG
jgi:hypothetical protein